MDEEQIQYAMIIRMSAELLRSLATASEPDADEGEKVNIAVNPDAISDPKQGLLDNGPSTTLQKAGESVSSTSATVSAAESEVKRLAIFGDQAKTENIEQTLGFVTETQQPATPAVVSIANPDAKHEPQSDIAFPEPPPAFVAQPANPPNTEGVIAAPPINTPPKDSLNTNSFFTFGQQSAESPQFPIIENAAPPTAAVTITEPPPALATQPIIPPDTDEIVAAASPPTGSQPFILDTGNVPATRPENSLNTEAIFTFGQHQAKSLLSQVPESIATFGHPTRPPSAEAIAASPPTVQASAVNTGKPEGVDPVVNQPTVEAAAPPPAAATSAPMAEQAPVIQPPDAPVPPTPATLEPPQPAVSPKSDPPHYDDLYGRFSKTYEQSPASPAVVEGRSAPNVTEDALESYPDPQSAETPEPIAVGDSDSPKPSLSSLPDYDLGKRFDDTHEWPLAIPYREHQQFLAENAEVIESLQSTPRQRWTPEQRQQAEQIRQKKEAYKSQVLDITKGPVQGAEPPPKPVSAFGSERTIETQDLFAPQRPAAQPQRGWHVGGVPTRQPAEQARLQAAAEAAPPADLGGLGGPEDLPAESPPQVALKAIDPEDLGNLASDALLGTTWREATRFEQVETTPAPKSGLQEHGPVQPPLSPYQQISKAIRDLTSVTPPVIPPTTPDQSRRRLDPASFSEGTRDQPRSVFDQPDEEEPLSSPSDDDDFWSNLPPIAIGGGRGGGRRRGGRRQGGSGSSDPTPPDNILHVWVDGGKLQEVERIGTFGQRSGDKSQGSGRGDGDQNSGSNAARGSTWSDWLAMQSLPAIGRYALQQGASTAASAASPFIGDANAAALGGAGESAGSALAGVATLGSGLGTGNPTFIAQGMAMLGKELVTLPKNLHDWSEALIDSQMAAKQWSPEVAGISFIKDIREIIRMQESGKATHESLKGAAMEWQQFQDYWRSTKDATTNMLNRGSEITAHLMRGWREHESDILRDAKASGDFDKWKEAKGKDSGFMWWGGEAYKGQWDKEYLDEQRKLHPDKFRSEMRATHAIFEDWMHDWQQGKFNMKSNRPVPK